MALTSENGLVDVADEAINEPTEEVNLDASVDSSSALSLQAEEQIHEQMRKEITQLEDEIETLKQALNRKEKKLTELKRELGLTRWSQLKQGFGQKYQSVQNSEVYGKLSHGAQTTKVAIGDAGEKASTALKNLGSATAKKWQEIRESQRFQSMEGKLWATTSAVKSKIAGPKGDEALPAGEAPPENQPPVI